MRTPRWKGKVLERIFSPFFQLLGLGHGVGLGLGLGPSLGLSFSNFLYWPPLNDQA